MMLKSIEHIEDKIANLLHQSVFIPLYIFFMPLRIWYKLHLIVFKNNPFPDIDAKGVLALEMLVVLGVAAAFTFP